MSAAAPLFGQRRLITLIVLAGAAFVLFFPARQLVQQRQHIGSLESRLTQLRSENEQLAQDVSRLSNPEEIEVLARERLGLVKPGERAYFVEPVPAPADRNAAPTDDPSTFERGLRWVVGLLRGGG